MRRDWTPEHDEALRALLVYGCSKSIIAETLTHAFGVRRTESSVTNRIFRCGWSFQVWRPTPPR